MTAEILEMEWAGERWLLSGERAAVWPRRRTLVVADVHCGKAAAFRARGVALPEGDTRDDLRRLTALGIAFGCRRLVVAGDFFHAPHGQTRETQALLDGWFAGRGFEEMHLVAGNHDRRSLREAESWGMIVHPGAWRDDGICLVHDPGEAPPAEPVICGHLHPCVRLADGRRGSLRLPCFVAGPRRMVLPSFGRLTGGRRIEPAPGERVFGIAEGRVMEIPAALLG